MISLLRTICAVFSLSFFISSGDCIALLTQYCPLTISLSGKADFLADHWRSGKYPVNWFAMRLYDLDGAGPRLWEWVGPTEGILVWNPSERKNMIPKGTDLFSLSFHGGHYSSGYKALASIAPKNTKAITGDLLNKIYVWVDKTGSARSAQGEFFSLAKLGVVSLGIAPDTDALGGLSIERGAITGQGYSFPTRDWWSDGGVAVADANSFLSDCLKGPAIYTVKADGGSNNPLSAAPVFTSPVLPPDFAKTESLLRFDILNGQMTMFSMPCLQLGKDFRALASNVTFAHALFARDIPVGNGHFLRTRFTMSPDSDNLYGATEFVEGDKPVGFYTWTATHVSGPRCADLLFISKHPGEFQPLPKK